jgi:hypothetical protein
MSRASRGRLEVPGSLSEVAGCAGLDWVWIVWPFERCGSWEGCDAVCVLGCVEDGLFVAPGAVVGGVDMPLGRSPAAGDAMVMRQQVVVFV